MYRLHWGLRESPFRSCLDPQFFFQGPAHEEALASLQHVATHRKGAVLITGAPGVGKTLVGRLAVRGLGSEVRTVWLRSSFSRAPPTKRPWRGCTSWSTSVGGWGF